MDTKYKAPRLLMLLAALMLTGALIFPIWKIELSAPQYPEGLVLKISANGIGGNIDIINGLNHYIGMRTIHSHDFVEFTLLPYIIGFLVAFGLFAVFINKKKLYNAYTVVFMLIAVVSMVDFYRWEYEYGHTLDPHAAIVVPGMSYQPPLLGYKQLLNFGAYSIPDIGGWLFIGAGVAVFIAWLLLPKPRWLRRNKHQVTAVTLLMLLVSSCSDSPEAISYNADACAFCKMTIVDRKFACEWMTAKGKAFKFDDLHCLFSYGDKNEGTVYINDFLGNGDLLKADKMFFVKSPFLKTPMAGQIASFADEASAVAFSKSNGGSLMSWKAVADDINKNRH